MNRMWKCILAVIGGMVLEQSCPREGQRSLLQFGEGGCGVDVSLHHSIRDNHVQHSKTLGLAKKKVCERVMLQAELPPNHRVPLTAGLGTDLSQIYSVSRPPIPSLSVSTWSLQSRVTQAMRLDIPNLAFLATENSEL